LFDFSASNIGERLGTPVYKRTSIEGRSVRYRLSQCVRQTILQLQILLGGIRGWRPGLASYRNCVSTKEQNKQTGNTPSSRAISDRPEDIPVGLRARLANRQSYTLCDLYNVFDIILYERRSLQLYSPTTRPCGVRNGVGLYVKRRRTGRQTLGAGTCGGSRE
jgi:hypothetical protein